jgi:hypothetical protein
MVSIVPHTTSNLIDCVVMELLPADDIRNEIVKVLITEVLTITDRQAKEFDGDVQPVCHTSFKTNPET